jgi:hypothetical protein
MLANPFVAFCPEVSFFHVKSLFANAALRADTCFVLASAPKPVKMKKLSNANTGRQPPMRAHARADSSADTTAGIIVASPQSDCAWSFGGECERSHVKLKDSDPDSLYLFDELISQSSCVCSLSTAI